MSKVNSVLKISGIKINPELKVLKTLDSSAFVKIRIILVGTYEGGDLEGGAGVVRTGGEPGPARPQHLHPCHHPCRLACLTGFKNCKGQFYRRITLQN